MIYQVIYKDDSGMKPRVIEACVMNLKNLLEETIGLENYQKVKSITFITDDERGVDNWLSANGFD